MNFTNTKAEITNTKVTIENNRRESKTEIVTNYSVTTNLSGDELMKFLNKTDTFFSDKISVVPQQKSAFMIKPPEKKMELKKFENQSNSMLTRPFLSTPKQTISNLNKRPQINTEPKKLGNQSAFYSLPKPTVSNSTNNSPSTSTYTSPYNRPTFTSTLKNPRLLSEFNSQQSNKLTNKILEDKGISKPSTSLFTKTYPTPIGGQRKTSLAELNSLKNTEPFISLPNIKTKKLGPGVLYILHHDEFKTSNSKRDGSRNDVQLLNKTFSKFNVKINLYDNYTAKQVRKVIMKIRNQDFTKQSCIVFAIMSHGNRNERIFAYEGDYSIDDDIVFEIIKNRTLIGKPKIFIAQACKGSFDTRKFATDTDSANTALEDPGVPDEIYKFYSATEGFVSFRDNSGSIFIQTFCKELENSGKTKNIRDIMESTISKVKNQTSDQQIPSMSVNNTAPYIFGEYL